MVGHVTGSASAVLRELPSWVRLVRADNPGPMTLDGTNTWVARGPGECLVIDPGPLDDAHLVAVARTAQAERAWVVLTHGHPDHSEGFERFLELCSWCRPWNPDESSLDVTIIPTPGHTADSVTLVVRSGAEPGIFTGDTILGRGTTVVAYPDGNLGDYLDSLRRLAAYESAPVFPGHGPALADSAAAARFYLQHRLARLEQVRDAVAAGAASAGDVVALVYADVDRGLWPAAELSVRAQLAYLDRESTDTSNRLDPP
jgi:glyoxylase-like metal-dependent hydrolase (beta-lactamase superfamily II)